MAESLYTKYRPQVFSDVVGQSIVESALVNALSRGSVSHAYLFTGPRGTGKTTMARLLAKALLCDGATNGVPDGTCEQCKRVAQGTHPDVIELDAASRTGVDTTREDIIATINYAPVYGSYRIYIIDEVHMLSKSAFNALLKTLEEPPEHVIFILCTTEVQQIPETVISRCQRFDFKSIAVDDIEKRLAYVCECEQVRANPAALHMLAQRAKGGLRNALTMLEQAISFGNGAVDDACVHTLLGMSSNDYALTMIHALVVRDAPAAFQLVNKLEEEGVSLLGFVNDCAQLISDAFVNAASNTPQKNACYSKDFVQVGALQFGYMLSVWGDIACDIKKTVNEALTLKVGIAKLLVPAASKTSDALASRVEALEKNVQLLLQNARAERVPACTPVCAQGNAPAPVSAPVPEAVPSAPAPVSTPVPEVAPSASASLASTTSAPVSASVPQAVQSMSAPVSAPVPKAERSAPAPVSAPVPEAEQTVAASVSPQDSQQAQRSDNAQASPLERCAKPAVLQQCWKQVMRILHDVDMPLAALLSNAQVKLAPDTHELLIGLPQGSNFAYKRLNTAREQESLQKVFVSVFGNRIACRILLLTDAAFQCNADTHNATPCALENSASSLPTSTSSENSIPSSNSAPSTNSTPSSNSAFPESIVPSADSAASDCDIATNNASADCDTAIKATSSCADNASFKSNTASLPNAESQLSEFSAFESLMRSTFGENVSIETLKNPPSCE